jgi:hypothetical protein
VHRVGARLPASELIAEAAGQAPSVEALLARLAAHVEESYL